MIPPGSTASRVLRVDEHVWRHTPFGSKFITVIIDLTPIRDKTGPSRLLDIVEGRSKKVFTTWLAAQSQALRSGIEDVAMDGFAGYKSAAAEELPDAVPVMDPFHLAALAGSAAERCQQRTQQETLRHRGRSGDRLYGIRRILLTGANLLTRTQADSLERGARCRGTHPGGRDAVDLPAHRGRVPRPRPYWRQRPTAGGHHECLYRSAGNADGADDARENPETQSC